MDPGATDNTVRSDADLMQRIGSGDTAAFRQVMERFSSRLVRLAYGMLGRQDESEDAAQEALIALWQAAPTWRAEATVAAYLRTVTTRKAIDLLRRRKFQSDDIMWEELQDPLHDPEATVQEKQDLQRLLTAMASLSDRQRTALLLTHFEDLPHREAAAALGIEPEAFSSLLARARRSLREKLTLDNGEPGHDT